MSEWFEKTIFRPSKVASEINHMHINFIFHLTLKSTKMYNNYENLRKYYNLYNRCIIVA